MTETTSNYNKYKIKGLEQMLQLLYQSNKHNDNTQKRIQSINNQIKTLKQD